MKIDIWTDGSCRPTNPGPGGWSAILKTTLPDGEPYEKAISGGKEHTTNNEMEMLAVAEALKAVKQEGCSITIHTDSKLVIGYMVWGWRAKASHLNRLIGEISARISLMGHQVEYRKVIAHNGDEMNERADELAKEAVPLVF